VVTTEDNLVGLRPAIAIFREGWDWVKYLVTWGLGEGGEGG
jgi:hypothetical protein